jgi:hypothetical protein
LLPTYSVLSCSKDTSRCSGKYHRSYSSWSQNLMS